MSQRLCTTSLHLRGETRQGPTAALTPQQKAAMTRAANRQQEQEANEAAALAALKRREFIDFPDASSCSILSILLAPRRAMVKAKDLAIWQKPTASGGASSSKRTLSRSPSAAPVAKKAKQSKSHYL
jgi:hypothetical protein